MRSLIAIVAGLAITASTLFALPRVAREAKMTDALIAGQIRRLPAMAEGNRVQLAEKLSEDRATFEAELLQQLRNPTSPEHRATVMYLIGLYRVEAAAPELAKQLIFKMDQIDPKRLPIWGTYPAVEALFRIGSHGIPPVLAQIEQSNDDLTIELGAKVVRTVYQQKIGRLIVDEAIASQPDMNKKMRLRRAKTALGQ